MFTMTIVNDANEHIPHFYHLGTDKNIALDIIFGYLNHGIYHDRNMNKHFIDHILLYKDSEYHSKLVMR